MTTKGASYAQTNRQVRMPPGFGSDEPSKAPFGDLERVFLQISSMNLLGLPSEPPVSDSPSAPRQQASYETLLAECGGPVPAASGPTYWLRSRPTIESTAIEVTFAQSALLHGTLDDWIPDLQFRRPFFVSVAANRAVAVCASVRIGEGADEAGVETAEGYRNLGHAANAVCAWANFVLASGKIPLYSTTWENSASQGVARKLGFELFGTEYSIQ
jgi:hypothetical protein